VATPVSGGRRRKAARAAAALGIAIVCVVLVAPILLYPFARDQGVFAAVADVVSAGGAPYRDAWDIKPPGIYYLFWLSFTLFGRSMLAPRLLDVLWTLAAAGVLIIVGRKLTSLRAGVAGAIFFLAFYALGFDYWTTTQCDGFASLPVALAGLALVRGEERRSVWLALLCGALVGVAIAIKLTLGGFLLLPVIAALTAGEPVRARVLRAAACVAGCALVLGAVALAMHATGALGDMLYLLFAWNAEYAALIQSRVPLSIRIPVETAKFLFGGQYLALKLISLLALVGVGASLRRRTERPLAWLAPAWAAVMLAGVYAQGKFHPYHWLPLLPPLALLAGQGLDSLHRFTAQAPRRWQAKTAMGAVVALVAGALGHGYLHQFAPQITYARGRVSFDQYAREFGEYGRGDFSLAADLEVARYLREHTSRDDCVYIWGFEPLVYFLSDRAPASRFITLQPLVSPWSPSEWRRELIGDLDRRKPAAILVLHNDVFPWVTGSVADSAQQLAGYPELSEFIQSRYRRATRVEDFTVWERR